MTGRYKLTAGTVAHSPDLAKEVLIAIAVEHQASLFAVIGLVLLVTLVVVLALTIMRVVFTTIGKAAEYAFILERRASTRLKLPVVIEKRIRSMEAP